MIDSVDHIAFSLKCWEVPRCSQKPQNRPCSQSHHSKVVKIRNHQSPASILPCQLKHRLGVDEELRAPLRCAIPYAIAGRWVTACIRATGTAVALAAAAIVVGAAWPCPRPKAYILVSDSIRVGGSDDNVDELHGSATLPFCFPTCFFTTPPWPSSLLSQMGNLNFIPTTQTFPPDLLLCFVWFKPLLGFNNSEPLALNLGASRRRAAHHAEAVADKPDHVVQVAVAVRRVLQPGADFLRKKNCQTTLLFLLHDPCSTEELRQKKKKEKCSPSSQVQ
jgi:hypothetical protein